MVDTISGSVIYVVDGNTFDIEVTHQRQGNMHKYNDGERIRIHDIDSSELSSFHGKISRNKLKNKIKGKEVLCHVHTRDSESRIIADVKII